MKVVVLVSVLVCACVAYHSNLADYANAADPHFGYKSLGVHLKGPGWNAEVFNLTSQKWLTTENCDRPIWWHYFVVIQPNTNATKRHDHAIVYVAGGSNTDPIPDAKDKDVAIIGDVVAMSGVPAGIVMQVMNQPIVFTRDPEHKSRHEDSLVSFTWWEFMFTGAPIESNIYFPMTKSGVAGINALEKILGATKFIVSGASKRGWTAWLTAAVDKRVVAAAPIVLDALNVNAFFHRQWQFYGGWTFALKSYVHFNLTASMDTPQMKLMMSYIDPFSYRANLTMPKLICNGVGDEFQMPDDTRYWVKDMPGENNLLLISTADHTMLTGLPTLIPGMSAFVSAIAHGVKRPSYDWSIDNATGEITVTTDTPPSKVHVYYALTTQDKMRDFRWAIADQKGQPCALPIFGGCIRYVPWSRYYVFKANEERTKFSALVPTPSSGWTAFFFQLQWTNPVGPDFTFTSPASVLPDTMPFPNCHGEGCRGTLV